MLSGESRAGAEEAAATRAEQRLPANKDFLGRRGGRESAARWTGAAGGGASLPVPAPFPGRAAEMRARWAGPGRAAFLWLVVAASAMAAGTCGAGGRGVRPAHLWPREEGGRGAAAVHALPRGALRRAGPSRHPRPSAAPTVSLPELRSLLAAGRARLIDVRSREEVAEGTIPGALNIPSMGLWGQRPPWAPSFPREGLGGGGLGAEPALPARGVTGGGQGRPRFSGPERRAARRPHRPPCSGGRPRCPVGLLTPPPGRAVS